MRFPTKILIKLKIILGKTTTLYKLKLGEQVCTIPTIGFNVETVSPCKGLLLTWLWCDSLSKLLFYLRFITYYMGCRWSRPHQDSVASLLSNCRRLNLILIICTFNINYFSFVHNVIFLREFFFCNLFLNKNLGVFII